MSFGRELASVLLKVFAVILTLAIIIGMIGFLPLVSRVSVMGSVISP